MRKLKLQMQVTVDGYISGPDGEMDWMMWDWDEGLKKYVRSITEPVDCIILGRKLAMGFIDTWAARAKDPGMADEFPEKMNDTPKVVFTKTLETHSWERTALAKGDLAEEVKRLKSQTGGDIIAYGGGTFVTALMKEGLIDEFHLFVNPAVIGNGVNIFKGLAGRKDLNLVQTKSFECGIVLLNYTLKQ